MPEPRTPERPDPNYVLELLQAEGQADLALLRPLVAEACAIAPSVVRDPTETNALSIVPVDASGHKRAKFLDVITATHRGFDTDKVIGPLGFSVKVCFRDPQPTLGPEWSADGAFYRDPDARIQWWRYEPKDASAATLSEVLTVARAARKSMLG